MHVLTLLNSPLSVSTMNTFLPFILVLVIWIITIKGYVLWFSARGNQKWWFIALLIINTFGLLEIIYLIWFRPKKGDKQEEESSPVHTSSPAV